MKKLFGLTFGGLQQKIINLVLVFLIALIAVFGAVSVYQSRHLSKIVGEASEKQQQAIAGVSQETMHQILEKSFAQSTAYRANIADDQFSEIANNIRVLRDMAQRLFENSDSLEPAPFALPDPSKDGTATAQVLYEEGVDYTQSEYLGIAAHMSDTMVSMFTQNSSIGGCYIGLADGTHIGVDDSGSNKYDDNGKQIPFPVRERPWYVGAKERGDIYFSGIEKDAFNGSLGLTCAAPVKAHGETVAVVGIDIVLEDTADYTDSVSENEGFAFIINDKGQVILAPENNGLFKVETSDMAEDIRETGSPELKDFINKALSEQTGLSLLDIGGKKYYMTGAPMKTVGWAVISVVDKELTEQPTVQMLSEYDRINDDAETAFEKGNRHSKHTTLVMILVVMVFGSGTALFIANRIVKPVEKMTRRIAEISGTDMAFEMDDSYRTNDEIEVLAESFADLSKKTRQYIKDITRITAEKERIGTELELATRIQADMLPNIYPAFPDRTEFDIYATMTPAKEVGGDFYDFFLIDDDHLGMVMADVSGKGVPAALFMMMSKILINNFAMQGASPAKVLEQTNETICRNNEEEMFVTVWFGILEISTGRITASNAGHEYPIIKRADGGYELFKDRHGFVVGGMEGMRYKEYEIQLRKGEALFLYTDGVPEATNAEDVLFGTERLLEAMNRFKDDDPKTLLTNVKQAIDDFVGEADQFDDLTMLSMTLL